MSSIGRGRGRGFSEVRETTLRRPGQSLTSTFSNLGNLTEIINLIENLVISDVTFSTKVDDIVQMIKESTKNYSLEQVFDNLHKLALEDRKFGIKLTTALSDTKVNSIIVGNSSLKYYWFHILQKDYEERKEIKEKSPCNFRNAISLLGEAFNSIKLGNATADFLITPLLQYLELLLETSEEEDIQLVTTQISKNGRKIYEKCPKELEDFMMLVRAILINRNLSARSREMLLFIIDLANQCFVPLSGKLQEFYSDQLDINSFVDVKHHDKDLAVNTELKNNVNDKDSIQFHSKAKSKPLQSSTDNNSVGPTMKATRHEKSLGLGAHEKSPPSTGHERPVVPRAIRGAGAVDNTKDKNTKKSPRGRKDKLTDEQIWSSKQNTSSKVWGHDDRFDKDY